MIMSSIIYPSSMFYPFNHPWQCLIFTKASCCLQFTVYSWNHHCASLSDSQVTSGAPNGKFWGKRPKDNNNVWIKLSEAILSILGVWRENVLVPYPPQQDWQKLSSQPVRRAYKLQPDLLVEGGGGERKGVRNWVWLKAEVNQGGRFLTNKTYQLFYLNPELPFSQQHFPSKDISFLSHLLASKHFPEEQIFRRTDPLAVPVIWY